MQVEIQGFMISEISAPFPQSSTFPKSTHGNTPLQHIIALCGEGVIASSGRSAFFLIALLSKWFHESNSAVTTFESFTVRRKAVPQCSSHAS